MRKLRVSKKKSLRNNTINVIIIRWSIVQVKSKIYSANRFKMVDLLGV